MSSNCANCGKKFTCGCQKAKADNGETVCKICKGKYNSKRIMKKSGQQHHDSLRAKQIRANENIKRSQQGRSWKKRK